MSMKKDRGAKLTPKLNLIGEHLCGNSRLYVDQRGQNMGQGRLSRSTLDYSNKVQRAPVHVPKSGNSKYHYAATKTTNGTDTPPQTQDPKIERLKAVASQRRRIFCGTHGHRHHSRGFARVKSVDLL